MTSLSWIEELLPSAGTVSLDLSEYDKPNRDILFLLLVAKYGTRQVRVLDAGLTLEVDVRGTDS